MFINVLDTAEIQKCSEDVRSIKVIYLYICINVCIVCVYEYRKKKKSDVYTSTHLRNGNLVKKHNAIQVLNKLLHNWNIRLSWLKETHTAFSMVVNQTSFREVNAQINWNKTEETLCLRSKEQLLKIIKMQLRGERKNPPVHYNLQYRWAYMHIW